MRKNFLQEPIDNHISTKYGHLSYIPELNTTQEADNMELAILADRYNQQREKCIDLDRQLRNELNILEEMKEQYELADENCYNRHCEEKSVYKEDFSLQDLTDRLNAIAFSEHH